jgi:hypothetical protein
MTRLRAFLSLVLALAALPTTGHGQKTSINATEQSLPACFGITLRLPYTHPKKGRLPGYFQYEYLQLWGDRAAIRLVMIEGKAPNGNVDAAADEFQILRRPKKELWRNANELLKIPIRSNPNPIKTIWDETVTWQSSYEWWNHTAMTRRHIRAVSDLPLQYAVEELAIRNLVASDGISTSRVYPRNDFVGFRWMATPVGTDTTGFNTLTPQFEEWINQKRNHTPPHIFQVVRRKDLPPPMAIHRPPWRRFAVQLTDKTGLILEVFEIPEK